MLKRAALLFGMVAVLPSGGALAAVQDDEPTQAQIAITNQTALAAIYCLSAVSRDGADPGRFDKDANWSGSLQTGYTQADMPIAVTFPTDEDGVARICVVEATLASRALQDAMRYGLETALESKPLDQGDSLIWMFGAGGENPRGLQFFPDYLALDKTVNVRLVAAAF